MSARPPTDRPTRELVECHEDIARLLDGLSDSEGPVTARVWREVRRRLDDLRARERALVVALRDAGQKGEVAPAELDAVFDPLAEQHVRAVNELLDEAERYLEDPPRRRRAIDELSDLLTWTFIAIEERADGD